MDALLRKLHWLKKAICLLTTNRIYLITIAYKNPTVFSVLYGSIAFGSIYFIGLFRQYVYCSIDAGISILPLTTSIAMKRRSAASYILPWAK